MSNKPSGIKLKPLLVLVICALVGGAIIGTLSDEFSTRITANEQEFKARNLKALLPPGSFDNEPWTMKISTGHPVVTAAYPITLEGRSAGTILELVSKAGYVGPIHILVAVNPEGAIISARAVKHRETPGLGDGIDQDKSDWMLQFFGKSLNMPAADRWDVTKDGGEFDQLTGATVTSRAVTEALASALAYYRNNGELLRENAPQTGTPDQP